MTDFQGVAAGAGLRVCILVSRFNVIVTDRLLDGARTTLIESGVNEDRLDVIWVPGAWELPAAASMASERGYDAMVALGCIIRGETAHFDHVSRAAVDGLARLQLRTGIPIALGILTPEDMSQAMARAGGDVGHAGVQAAEAALEMADLQTRLRSD